MKREGERGGEGGRGRNREIDRARERKRADMIELATAKETGTKPELTTEPRRWLQSAWARRVVGVVRDGGDPHRRPPLNFMVCLMLGPLPRVP